MKKFSLIALGALTLAACSSHDDEPAIVNNDGRIVPTYTLNSMSSRAEDGIQDDVICENQEVGFFVTTADDSNPTTLYENVSYTADGVGGFSSSSSAMFWPTTGNIHVYAYGPVQSGASISAANTFSVQSDQSTEANYLASDLIMATPKKNVAQTENDGKVEMTFKHMLTKLKFEIKPKDADVDLAGGVVTIMNVVKSCSFDVVSASITADSQTGEIVVGTLPSDISTNKSATLAAIVVNQKIAQGTALFKIEVGSGNDMKRYVYTAESDIDFTAGVQSSYNVSVSTAGASMQLVSTLTAWDKTNSASDINMYEEDVPRQASVGDWYLADGTFADGGEAAPQNAIGIVFSLDTPDGYQAYVSSILSGIGNKKWADQDGSYSALLETQLGTAFYTDFSSLSSAVDGLSVTETVKNSSEYEGFIAFNAALTNADYASAPATSSGWFIPAIGEMMMLMEYFAGATAEDWDSSASTIGTGYTLSTLYSDAIAGVSNSFPAAGGTYWTISEKDASNAWVAVMNQDTALKVKSNGKKTNNGCRTHLILLAE
ncbi:MAG: fimbrillin family protein [Bacteroidales bacterium]|nr:fimbrillin family protein [Bacteroidales bacterium]